MDYWYFTLNKNVVKITEEENNSLVALSPDTLKEKEMCRKIRSIEGQPFICTLPKGHTGPHMATSSTEVCAIWVNSILQPEQPHLLALKEADNG